MNKRFLMTAAVAWALCMSGCATRTKMAFENDAERLTEKSRPVFLMTATIKNEYKQSFQPRLAVVHVEKSNAKDAADHLNFTMDDKARDEPDTLPKGNNYLLRMQLEPGSYEIVGMTSIASSFPIHGFYFAPMHSLLTAGESGVFYLGHVDATVRERQGSEFKAGSTLPLIDQAIAGASGGTFDIDISDRFDVDEPAFRAKFAALAGIEIKKAVLPPFDRAVAQKWWEAH